MRNEQEPPLHVYKVDDGSTTWVAAKHPGEVLRILAISLGCSVREYEEEYEPLIKRISPGEEIRIHQDGVKIDAKKADQPLPRATRFEVMAITRAQDWIDMKFHGVIASTEY